MGLCFRYLIISPKSENTRIGNIRAVCIPHPIHFTDKETTTNIETNVN